MLFYLNVLSWFTWIKRWLCDFPVLWLYNKLREYNCIKSFVLHIHTCTSIQLYFTSTSIYYWASWIWVSFLLITCRNLWELYQFLMNSYELDLDSLYILQSQLTVPTKLAVYFSVKFDEFYLFLNNKKKSPKSRTDWHCKTLWWQNHEWIPILFPVGSVIFSATWEDSKGLFSNFAMGGIQPYLLQ